MTARLHTLRPRPNAGPDGATVVHVVGARPNFVKMAPLVDALRARGTTRQIVVHTGQHYDRRMSEEILEDLGFPAPDHSLGIGSGSHGEQTGKVLIAFERILLEVRPGLVVVAGDVNSTLACALAAAKLHIPVAHLESGLRSDDWTMPEEVNRVVTDRLSDVLLTHSPEAEENLAREGVDTSRIRYVGNTMIDSLLRFESVARERAVWDAYGLPERAYMLVTLHRPSNVDEPDRLAGIVDGLCRLAEEAPLIFPIHPRTRARLAAGGDLERLEASGVRCAEPVGYLDFLSLQAGAGIIVTDSGGVQEEASALGIPCYTLRANTERPVTITRGTNVLLGDDPASLLTIPIAWRPPTPCAIPLWDGRAADRAADALLADYPALAEIREGGMTPRADVLGCAIDRLDMTATLDAVEHVIASRRFTQHMSINAAKLVTMHDDAKIRDIIAGCGLVNADGQSVVWASKLLGDPLPERVAGIDLMGALLGLAERRGYRVYFLGARAEVLAEAVERIRELHPDLQVAGARDGYFADDEAADVCAAIRDSRADLLFVAMTSPRKEYFLGEFGPGLGVPFVMGVGGSIDVIAGVTRRAPVAWQRMGLEWLYRLLQEPRRMFKRYAVTNTRFALLVGRALLTRTLYPRQRITGS